jgi:uncharacterized protein (DUF1499 family)
MMLFAAVGLASTTLLAPCPPTPNCVSTLATDPRHAIPPLHYTTSPQGAKERLLGILHSMPRTSIVSSGNDTIGVEFRTALFRFVDDALFVIDDSTRTIHFRSASRVGRSDLGVNRRRMESIRKAFAATR